MKIKLFEEFSKENITEQVVMKASRPKFDITKEKHSIAAQVEPLIGTMEKMPIEEIKDKFLSVLNDPSTYASNQVISKWKQVIQSAKNKISLMQTITNLYLKAAQMGVNDSLEIEEKSKISESKQDEIISKLEGKKFKFENILTNGDAILVKKTRTGSNHAQVSEDGTEINGIPSEEFFNSEMVKENVEEREVGQSQELDPDKSANGTKLGGILYLDTEVDDDGKPYLSISCSSVSGFGINTKLKANQLLEALKNFESSFE